MIQLAAGTSHLRCARAPITAITSLFEVRRAASGQLSLGTVIATPSRTASDRRAVDRYLAGIDGLYRGIQAWHRAHVGLTREARARMGAHAACPLNATSLCISPSTLSSGIRLPNNANAPRTLSVKGFPTCQRSNATPRRTAAP